MTSYGEIVDLEFYREVDPPTVLEQLRQQLPAEVPLYTWEVVPLSEPGSESSPAGSYL